MLGLMLGLLVAAVAAVAAPASRTLLTLQRSLNANVVRYDVRLSSDGLLDQKDPVDAYWILGARDGSREELGLLERRVYGAAAVVAADRRSMEVVIRGMPARPLRVRLASPLPIVEVEIAGERAVLGEVFLNCGAWSVDSVRLRGRTAQGNRVEEILQR